MTLPPKRRIGRDFGTEFLGTGRSRGRGQSSILGAKADKVVQPTDDTEKKLVENTKDAAIDAIADVGSGIEFAGDLDLTRGGIISDVLKGVRDNGSMIESIMGTKFPEIAVKNRGPVMLMPMRLEYRLLDVFVGVRDVEDLVISKEFAIAEKEMREFSRLKDELGEFLKDDPLHARPVTAFQERKGQEKFDKLRRKAERMSDLILDRSQGKLRPKFFDVHLQMRWYPDENFATKGVEPETEIEAAARTRLMQAIGGAQWWKAAQSEDLGHSSAWQHYVAELGGVARAVHLLRTADTAVPDPAWEEQIGRITALPSAVVLYSISSNGKIEHLATGAPIAQNTEDGISPISYTPEVLGTDDQPNTWLSNFPTAVEMGMGITITEKHKVLQAQNAQWIVAVGLHRHGGKFGQLDATSSEIEDMLRARIANGELAVLPQDSNTNNTANQPTSYRRFETDVKDTTKRALAQENGAFSGAGKRSVDLVSEVMGIDPAILRQAIEADDQGFSDAQAMLRVIGPALIDDALDNVTHFKGLREDELIEVLAAGVFARGALPAMRFGSSAYGLLPVSNVLKSSEQEDDHFSDDQKKVLGFVGTIARIGRVLLPAYAKRVVPVMQPGDTDSAEVFETIIKQNRVATRVEVNDPQADGNKPKAITCPYVRGGSASRRPNAYLNDLRTKSQDKLPDPNHTDTSWPLLYRLARMTLTRQTLLTVIAADSSTKSSLGVLAQRDKETQTIIKKSRDLLQSFSVEGLEKGTLFDGPVRSARAFDLDLSHTLTRLSRRFGAGLSHLAEVAKRPNGDAQLEILMLEVMDLLQHRFDAFATGLAYLKLAADRQHGNEGLYKGWYGFLGRLRKDSKTGKSDGYILAPSTPQAVSAAVMRSAHLRHRGEGAFEIDLSSRRVRGALKLMDVLSRGHSLNEALGMRGERYLHDANQDIRILPLRVRFPNKGQFNEGRAFSRVFDGLAFLDDTNIPQDATLATFHRRLTDDLDALSDVIMAEATHQRAMGAAEVASAWLKVMSGGVVPGRPTFLRTQRAGHNSTYKASYMRSAQNAAANASPREIAEPLIAAMADELLVDFDTAGVEIEVNLTDGQGLSSRLPIGLKNDLNMRPIDLIIGGAAELQVRAKTFALRRFLETPGVLAATGAMADAASFVMNLAGVTIHTDALAPLLTRAAHLRSALQNGRALRPADLNAMAPAIAGPLVEAQDIACVESAVAALQQRLIRLNTDLTQRLAAARTDSDTYVGQLENARNLQDNALLSAQVVSNAIATAEAARRIAMDSAAPLAIFGEPSVLRVVLLDEALPDPISKIETPMGQVFERIEKTLAVLQVAIAAPSSGFTDLGAAEKVLNMRIKALQSALDGDALPIFPPVPRNAANLRATYESAAPLANALNDWTQARKKLAGFRDLMAIAPGTEVRPVSFEVTNDDEHDPTQDASAGPRAQHFEHVWGKTGELDVATDVAGFVADEWVGSRPSAIQNAGMAVNYDSPQSEPPHCVLLGVPDPGVTSNWSEDEAAGIIREAINWMQIRALSATQRVVPASLFPHANQVASKTGKSSGNRIPNQPITHTTPWDLGAAGITILDANSTALTGVKGASILERPGFRINLE